jgi:hypothetical protein
VASLLFRDKVYWRRPALASSPGDGLYHAFVNVTPYAMRGSWGSLCGKHTISGPGGTGRGRGSNQKINRPVVAARCPECDAAEAKRRMRPMPASRRM